MSTAKEQARSLIGDVLYENWGGDPNEPFFESDASSIVHRLMAHPDLLRRLADEADLQPIDGREDALRRLTGQPDDGSYGRADYCDYCGWREPGQHLATCPSVARPQQSDGRQEDR